MSFLNSVMKSVRTRPFFALSSALVMVAGMLFGANIATADSVWVQSYERTSQTEACTAQPGETPWQASWGTNSSWSRSWEQWANSGQGGWVCSRSITWARTSTASSSGGGGGSVTYAVGDVGPGGGLVFLISGGLTYEMAPKAWGIGGVVDPPSAWCSNTSSLLSGTFLTVVGTGEANTELMVGACTIGAAKEATAPKYSGGGFTDWFLPSMDELIAMYTYSLVGGFNTATYGFAGVSYWSSSQFDASSAWNKDFGNGGQGDAGKGNPLRVRPVRAF